MVLGNLTGPGVLLIWKAVGQGPTALAAGAGRGCLGFFLICPVSLLSPSLSGTRPDIDCNTASKAVSPTTTEGIVSLCGGSLFT